MHANPPTPRLRQASSIGSVSCTTSQQLAQNTIRFAALPAPGAEGTGLAGIVVVVGGVVVDGRGPVVVVVGAAAAGGTGVAGAGCGGGGGGMHAARSSADVARLATATATARRDMACVSVHARWRLTPERPG